MSASTFDHIGSVFLRVVIRRMKDLGLSQTTLAKRMHVSRPYITKLLQTDVNISFRTAAKLAKALEMDFMPVLTPCRRRKMVEYKECYSSKDPYA